MTSNIKNLNRFNITEMIYAFGVRNFLEQDMNFWLNKDPLEFLNKYAYDPNDEVERIDNILECYYLGADFKNNIKNIFYGEVKEDFGKSELSRVPLYSKKTNEVIGTAAYLCTENTFDNLKYESCDLTYYINNDYIPQNIASVDNNSTLNNNYGSLKFTYGYIARPTPDGTSTFFSIGDYFTSDGFYSLENGLNKTEAINNIFLPYNTEGNKRSVILNFPTLKSHNFLPQEEYGADSIIDGIPAIRNEFDKEFNS